MKKRSIIAYLAAINAAIALTACSGTDGQDFTNPGDRPGGGGTADIPTDIDNTKTENGISDKIKFDLTDIKNDTDPSNATAVRSDKITESGSYIVSGEHASGITVAKGLTVHLFLNGATVKNDAGPAIAAEKNSDVTITLIGDNTVSNGSGNAIHIKGDLSVNGGGTLNVKSTDKSAVKVSDKLTVVDATVNAESKGNCISAQSVIADSAVIDITSSQKDGIHAELDYDDPDDVSDCVFTLDSGFVALNNTNYTCTTYGDGIQADTFVYVNGGAVDMTTAGVFVEKTVANKQKYNMTDDDFCFIKEGDGYKKVADDRFGRGVMYGLSQSCKGIKVGKIEYDVTGNNGTVTTYSITENAEYSVIIDGGTININSTDDCIHTNGGDIIINGGQLTLTTCDDGMSADDLLKINGGTVDIKSSYEGLESVYVEINGGNISVVSQDDGINASSDIPSVKEHIIIHGGKVNVNASGDGIDSNGSILIDGGTVTVYGPTDAGNSGLDSETGIRIDGGTVLVTSTSGMVEIPAANSLQHVISFAASSSIAAGSELTLADQDDSVLFSADIKKSCQSIIISLPNIEREKTYKLYDGDKLLETFTVSQIITKIGVEGAFGPGHFPGGNGGRPNGR